MKLVFDENIYEYEHKDNKINETVGKLYNKPTIEQVSHFKWRNNKMIMRERNKGYN